MKTTLGQLLGVKGHDVWAIEPDASVYSAIQIMAEKGIGLLLVREGGRPVGVISERDYARRIILEGRSSRDTPVSEIMTRRIVYGQPQQTVQEALALMTEIILGTFQSVMATSCSGCSPSVIWSKS